ncbi:MAG: hypothetical protein QOI53_4158, partial [Verrucomicrobiota bacterium]|nr:hypothetical protein [Verrucomicrobiota bacterium]
MSIGLSTELRNERSVSCNADTITETQENGMRGVSEVRSC